MCMITKRQIRMNMNFIWVSSPRSARLKSKLFCLLLPIYRCAMSLISLQASSFFSHFIACAGLVDGRIFLSRLMCGKYLLKYFAEAFPLKKIFEIPGWVKRNAGRSLGLSILMSVSRLDSLLQLPITSQSAIPFCKSNFFLNSLSAE